MTTSIPEHIAIIMDGNGRWAQTQALPRIEGHIAGVQAVKRIVSACLKHKIKILTLFAFSTENWSRPKEEVDGLMGLLVKAIQQEMLELHDKNIRLCFTGHLSELPPLLQKHIKEAERHTENNQAMILNIVINYGGKWDILEAVKKLIPLINNHTLCADTLTEDDLRQQLATAHLPDPDLLIRTSGECRISNFFLWQLAYTELYFTEVYWPDFSEQHLIQAIDSFQQRQRRFGNILPEEV